MGQRFAKRHLRGVLVVVSAVLAGTASAKGHLQARPTLVDLPAQASATRMTLANTGDAPVGAQVRVFAWSQEGGEDRLVPATDVVVSPPIARVPSGGEQVVRVVRTGAPAAGRDRTYRLVVDELPGSRESATAVAVRMQYVLPLFLRAADATAPAVTCRVASLELTCTNTGGQAAQLGRTRLVDADGHAAALSSGLFGYVLPGAQRRWTLPRAAVPTGSAALHLDTQLNGQPATLPVQRAP
jgi:fimbrial chaperone protein